MTNDFGKEDIVILVKLQIHRKLCCKAKVVILLF